MQRTIDSPEVKIASTATEKGAPVCVRYKNWQGEIAVRNIVPLFLYFGSTEQHKEKQWLLEVWDIERSDNRTYAVNDIQEWLRK